MKVFNKHRLECGGIGDPLRTQTMDDSLAPVLCFTSCYIILSWNPVTTADNPLSSHRKVYVYSVITSSKGTRYFSLDRSLLY